MLVAGEEGLSVGVLEDFVQNKYEINSLIIVLVVFRQNCGVLLLLEPVLQDVVVCFLHISAGPNFLVLRHFRRLFHRLFPFLFIGGLGHLLLFRVVAGRTIALVKQHQLEFGGVEEIEVVLVGVLHSLLVLIFGNYYITRKK